MIAVIRMKPEHIKDIARLEKECFGEPWSEKSLTEELENKDSVFLVAADGEKVLGYGGMHTPSGECYIDNIAVFSEFRGMGIGEKITKELVGRSKALGSAFISLEVRPSNTAAVRLYEKLGFKRVGARKNFYQNPAEDGLILTSYFNDDLA